jgi:hypothetical protein
MNRPTRKIISLGEKIMEEPRTKIVSQDFYSTNGETLIIVKDVETCTIELNSSTTEKIIIKTLTSCIIVPDNNRIDEDWDQLDIERGACVQFQFVEGIWYILSSDGIKLI